jgi:hypothetical protein
MFLRATFSVQKFARDSLESTLSSVDWQGFETLVSLPSPAAFVPRDDQNDQFAVRPKWSGLG